MTGSDDQMMNLQIEDVTRLQVFGNHVEIRRHFLEDANVVELLFCQPRETSLTKSRCGPVGCSGTVRRIFASTEHGNQCYA